MTSRDERYRREAQRQRNLAAFYRDQFLNLSAVCLIGTVWDMGQFLDDDDLAEVRRRARDLAQTRTYSRR